MRAPRQAIKGYQGVGTITYSVYYLPLLDADGNIQVIRAHGVEEIAIVARTRLPPIARETFPVIRASMPWMETGAGHVELLIGLDNKQWLPAHVEDSWDPDDDMRLMRSVFGHRYMITDGWGRDLLPPDNAPGNQAGTQGARPSRRTQLKKSDCPSIESGARAPGTPEIAAGQALPLRGEGAWGHALRLAGWLLAEGPPPPGEGQLRGAGREDLAKRLATHQHRKSALELHTPRFRGERGQDSRWYRHRREGRPTAHRPHQGEAIGASSDRAGEVEGSKEPPGGSLRAGHLPRTQGDCQARCS
jgi:hypothetical protein